MSTPHIPEKLKDFRAFLWLVWKHLNLPDPTLVQYDIATYLQRGPRRKIIEGFRGVGKSWITSAYVVWRLLLNPQLNFLVVSASKDRSDAFSTFTLRLIKEIPVLKHLIPKSEQRESKIAFDVALAEADHAPSVKSVGIFGQLTGTRADEIVADDIEVPGNSYTQGMRDKLSEAVKEFDAILKPGGIITYLGTPQTEQSLYNVLPERGYDVRIWPAKYPDERLLTVYGERLAPLIVETIETDPSLVGFTTDPKRFSNKDLMEREASYGRSGFALQFMLDTSLSDADRHPLKINDLIVMGTHPEQAPEKVIWTNDPQYRLKDIPCVGFNGDYYYSPIEYKGSYIDYTGSVLAIDPSGRGKDETSYAVVKMLNGQLFVPEACGLRGGYDEKTLTELSNIAKRNNVNKIIIESNFGDGMFTQLLTPYLKKIYPCTTEEVRHNKQKELRIIDTLEPVLNQHRLIIDKKVIEKDFNSTRDLPPEQAVRYQLMYQLSHITKDRNSLAQDDRLDVLAMAVAYWVEQMAQEAEEKIRTRQLKQMEKEYAVWFGSHSDGFSLAVLNGQHNRTGKSHRWIKR